MSRLEGWGSTIACGALVLAVFVLVTVLTNWVR
jgi:hypothetical protein